MIPPLARGLGGRNGQFIDMNAETNIHATTYEDFKFKTLNHIDENNPQEKGDQYCLKSTKVSERIYKYFVETNNSFYRTQPMRLNCVLN